MNGNQNDIRLLTAALDYRRYCCIAFKIRRKITFSLFFFFVSIYFIYLCGFLFFLKEPSHPRTRVLQPNRLSLLPWLLGSS